jgi:hypothetical protein
LKIHCDVAKVYSRSGFLILADNAQFPAPSARCVLSGPPVVMSQ